MREAKEVAKEEISASRYVIRRSFSQPAYCDVNEKLVSLYIS